MPKKSGLDPESIQDYVDSYHLARENIVNSISKLRKRNWRDNVSPGEVAENDGKILDLAAEKAILDAKRAAFEADKHVVTPPNSEQLDNLKALLSKVDKLNVNQRIFDQVLLLSTEALTTFNAIHPNQEFAGGA